MALFPFYSLRKPRQFEHKPIYYSPRKEEMDDRIVRIKREMGLDVSKDEYKPQIKGSFVEGTTHLRKSLLRGDDVRSRRTKNGRLAIFLAVLLVLLWFLFVR